MSQDPRDLDEDDDGGKHERLIQQIIEEGEAQLRTIKHQRELLDQQVADGMIGLKDAVVSIDRLTKSYKAVCDHLRQIDKKDQKLAESAGYEFRRKVLANWFADLPRERQIDLLKELTRITNEAA